MSEFDHLVLATPLLSETVQTVARLLGMQPAEGGQHVGRGTRNFLLGLGNGGYLEIIGPDPEQPEAQPPRVFGIDHLTVPRLVTWAVRVSGMDAAIASARARGLDPGDAWEMARATPAGDMLRWRLTLDPAGSHTGVVPFLIDWGNTRHPSLDLPQATLLSLIAIHPDPAMISARLQSNLHRHRDPARHAAGAHRRRRGSVRPGHSVVTEGAVGLGCQEQRRGRH